MEQEAGKIQGVRRTQPTIADFEKEEKRPQAKECPASRNNMWSSADSQVIDPQSYDHRNSILPKT